MIDRKPVETVFIVDDEPGIRNSLRKLCESVGQPAKTFACAQEFLDDFDVDQPGAAIIDVRMNGMGGLELQVELARRGSLLPVIMLSGHGDVPIAVQATRSGAIDFVEKPFRTQEILDLIHRALRANADAIKHRAEERAILDRFEKLTPREREVLDHVVEGHTTKRIALDLDRSPKTVDIHRSNLMRKMRVSGVAELVQLVFKVREAIDRGTASSNGRDLSRGNGVS